MLGRYQSAVPFSWLNNIPQYGYTAFVLFTSALRYLGCVHLLVIMDNTARNTYVQVFNYTRQMRRSGIAELYGDFMFNLFKDF